MKNHPIARILGWLITGMVAASLLLPIFVWYTVREMRSAERRAQESSERARRAEEKLRATESRQEEAEQELAKTEATLRGTRSELAEAERRLVTARDTFDKFKNRVLSKADFLKTGLGIQTPAERSHDVAKELRRLREAKDWEGAAKLAMGWLEFHRGSSTTADASALVEVALVWRRLADLDSKLLPQRPFKTKREFWVEANKLFEEAEGKASIAQPKSFIAGNWGTVLRDLANSDQGDPDVPRYRRDAVRLLDLATREPTSERAWQVNRVCLEGDMRSRDPAGFASFCEGLPYLRKVTSDCGKVLFNLVRKNAAMARAEREQLVCRAAKWARSEQRIQEECRKVRKMPHPP